MTNLEKGINYLKKYNNINLSTNNNDFKTFRALMSITIQDKLDSYFYQI